MNILFIHRSYPAQFKFLATFLSLDANNKVMFITEEEATQIEGVNKVLYKANKPDENTDKPYLHVFEFAIFQASSVAQKAIELKEQGFIPDVIYGFSGWGSSMFIKEIFPEVPFICYCEWFLNPEGGKIGFGDAEPISLYERIKLRCNNAHVLTTLSLCDAAIAPTQWQKQQFPKEFQDKIKVIHDGFDTGRFNPDENVKFEFYDETLGKNLVLTGEDEIITYGTRGFEPSRGFPQFMEAVEKLLKTRPNAHVLIAGADDVHYGVKPEKSYKTQMLEKLDIDLSRVHFVGTLPFNKYREFLQVSTVHVYLTVPFVLSWSVIEALSSGCCLVASDTAPLQEVITDGQNGLLTDFFDADKLAQKIEYALGNKALRDIIGKNARKFAVEEFDLVSVLPHHLEMIKSVMR